MTARPTEPPATSDAPGAARDAAPAAPADALGGYCRRCGYALRGLASRACPECGRTFDPADPRTFARRPPRRALWRGARRVAVVAVAVLLPGAAGVGWLWRDWHGEQATVGQLRATGANVQVGPRRPIGPEWLRRHWPARWSRWFDRADAVYVGSLDLFDGVLVDLGTVEWTGLDDLSGLAMDRCRITSSTVEWLRGLKRLETLNLYRCDVDRSAYPALGGLPALVNLTLDGTRTTDADVAHLRGLRRLQQLDLSVNPIGDAGVAHLSGLANLERLELQRTGVTDAGLAHLHGLTSLRYVDLVDTAVTADGIRRLRAALPDAHVRGP